MIHVTETYANDEPWQAETANGHTQIDGPTTIDATADTVATRQVVVSTVADILGDGNFEALDDHLAGEDYIQHNPRFADGVSGLVAVVAALAEHGVTMSYKGISQTAGRMPLPANSPKIRGARSGTTWPRQPSGRVWLE